MPLTGSATRAQVRPPIDWRGALWVAIAAGVVSIFLQMLMAWLFQNESPWTPPRRIAAMLLGETILSPNAPLTAVAVVIAAVVHFGLALVYGLLVAVVVHRLSLGAAAATGAGLLLALYIINFYAIAPALFPWFAGAGGWVALFNYIVFGALAGAGYVWLRRKRFEAKGNR